MINFKHINWQSCHMMHLYINRLTLGAIWLYLLPGTKVQSPLLFRRLLPPVISYILIGDVLKKHKGNYLLELFTYVFAAHRKSVSFRRKMETAGELCGEPLSSY